MRSGENLRDLFYQSPYLKRFSNNKITPFSHEKQSANKENVSPICGTNLWISNTNFLRSGEGSGSTASGYHTVQSTPIQNEFRGIMTVNSNKDTENRESPDFPISFDNSGSPQMNDENNINYSETCTSSFNDINSHEMDHHMMFENQYDRSSIRKPRKRAIEYENVDILQEEFKENGPFTQFQNSQSWHQNPFNMNENTSTYMNQMTPMRQAQNLDIRFQTIEEVQSDMGEIDSNSENTQSQRTSGASTQLQDASSHQLNDRIQGSSLRLRTRPVLQERNLLEQTPNIKSSIIKKINFSHAKGGTAKKVAKDHSKNVLQLR